MGHKIERKIKRRDAVDDAAGHSQSVGRFAASGRLSINRDHFAGKTFRLARRPGECGYGTFNFPARISDRFCGFGNDRIHEFPLAALELGR